MKPKRVKAVNNRNTDKYFPYEVLSNLKTKFEKYLSEFHTSKTLYTGDGNSLADVPNAEVWEFRIKVNGSDYHTTEEVRKMINEIEDCLQLLRG